MFFKHLRNFIGNAEVTETDHDRNRKSRIMVYYGIITDIINKSIYVCNHLTNTLDTHHRARNRLICFLQSIEKKVESFLNSLNKTSICKHSLCKHRYNCLVYPIIVNMIELTLGIPKKITIIFT